MPFAQLQAKIQEGSPNQYWKKLENSFNTKFHILSPKSSISCSFTEFWNTYLDKMIKITIRV